MGWTFRELCRWEVSVRMGWLPMTEIFSRDNLESEVVRGACVLVVLLVWGTVSLKGQLSTGYTAF